MLYYFRRYPLSLVIMAVIFYLSFFTPPKSNLEEIPNIDKLVHVCMYGGLCSILWFEYLRTHRMINWSHILWGGILAPIAMSGCIELMQTYLTTNRSGDWPMPNPNLLHSMQSWSFQAYRVLVFASPLSAVHGVILHQVLFHRFSQPL